MTTSSTPAPIRSRRRSPLSLSATTAKYLSLVAASLVVLVPLVSVVMTSLKTSTGMAKGSGPLTAPHDWFKFLQPYLTPRRQHVTSLLLNRSSTHRHKHRAPDAKGCSVCPERSSSSHY